jgi:hypothetical protein
MWNNRYNLNGMYFLRYIFIILMASSISNPLVLAEPRNSTLSKPVDNVKVRYAVAKVDGRKKKLYTRGDIFYSPTDMTRCLRIQDIKRDTLILNALDSKETFIVRPGERIPLEDLDIVFEKTVE